jgi:hypothetical protein
MESASLKVLLLNIAVVLTVSLTALAESTKPYFSVTISAPQRVKAGGAAIVSIAVTNTSKSTTAFSSGFREDQGEFECDFNVLASDGKQAPETRYMKAIKGKDQGPGPQLVTNTKSLSTRLAPGEALKFSADLNKLFDLAPGKYTVQLSHFESAWAEHPGAVVKSNTIILTIVP